MSTIAIVANQLRRYLPYRRGRRSNGTLNVEFRSAADVPSDAMDILLSSSDDGESAFSDRDELEWKKVP